MEWKIDTIKATDPIFVTECFSEDDGPVTRVEIRIGKRRKGETRYADLRPWQARKLAAALMWAASGENPDRDPMTPGVELAFMHDRESKPKR